MDEISKSTLKRFKPGVGIGPGGPEPDQAEPDFQARA